MKKTVLSIVAIALTVGVALLAAQVNARLDQSGGPEQNQNFYANSNLPLQQNGSENYQPF
jgi:hypothetical protein